MTDAAKAGAFCFKRLHKCADARQFEEKDMTRANPVSGQAAMADKVTFRNGYWFFFNDGEDRIAVFGSAMTGKEKVFFNDELVSEHRSLGFNSCHRFERGGRSYEILFLVTNLMRGAIECIALSGDRVIGRETKAFYTDTRKGFWTRIALFFAGGLFFGIGVAAILEDTGLGAWLWQLLGGN
jgi:hypothetical protein